MILRRLLLVLLAAAMAAPASATWSIIAVNVVTREVAVGCATCINYADLARNLPVVRPGLGVANIQSSGDVGGVRKPIIWQGFEDHLPPSEILKDIRELPWFQNLQLGIVSFDGPPVTFSGKGANAAVCNVAGQVGDLIYAIQGNLMTGPVVCSAAEAALLGTDGDLAERMMAAMQAARAMGGDARCSCPRPDPTTCGAPPPFFTYSAYSGFMIVSRIGDDEGVCSKTDGCAQGSYYFYKNIQNGPGDLDPIEELQQKYDNWRTKQKGRPDHLKSEVLVDRQQLVADGVTSALVTVVLRDIDGVQLPSGGANLSIVSNVSGTPTAIPGPVVDHGDGTYSFELTATTTGGRGEWSIWVDFGATTKDRLLWPPLGLETDALVDLHVGRYDLSASEAAAIPFTLNRGASEAGRAYYVLGSYSGTVPGFDFQGITVPLNRDPFLEFTWFGGGPPECDGGHGSLDSTGRSEAWLDLDPSAWAALVGERMDFCALFFGPTPQVSSLASFWVIP